MSHFRDFDRECVTVNAGISQDEANVVVSHRDKGIERFKTALDMMDLSSKQ
jgi:hypothetical protein